MNIQTIIAAISTKLTDTFSSIDTWFDKDAALRSYKPENGGWTIDEILEHIALTNHFLLILINKGTNKALQQAQHEDVVTALQNHVFNWDKLTEVGLHGSFGWIRPQHMEPTGKAPEDVRLQLKEQVAQCLHNLDRMRHGEGVLYKTTMTVNNLGKIDVYEYIYFLAQHGQRHITQMQKNEAAFEALHH